MATSKRTSRPSSQPITGKGQLSTQTAGVASPQSDVVQLDIRQIQCKNDARELPKVLTKSMQDSIKKQGVLEPITVRQLAVPENRNIYEVVDGVARYLIVWLARGISATPTFIPATIVEMNNFQAWAYAIKRNNQALVRDVFEHQSENPGEALCNLAGHLTNAPRLLGSFSRVLDKIADGKLRLRRDPRDLFARSFLRAIRSHLDSWIEIANDVNGGNGPQAEFQPAYAQQRSTLLALMNDTLSSYTAAHAQSMGWCEDGEGNSKPILELLKRYRIFTRYICKFAKEVWPDINLNRLEELP